MMAIASGNTVPGHDEILSVVYAFMGQMRAAAHRLRPADLARRAQTVQAVRQGRAREGVVSDFTPKRCAASTAWAHPANQAGCSDKSLLPGNDRRRTYTVAVQQHDGHNECAMRRAPEPPH